MTDADRRHRQFLKGLLNAHAPDGEGVGATSGAGADGPAKEHERAAIIAGGIGRARRRGGEKLTGCCSGSAACVIISCFCFYR